MALINTDYEGGTLAASLPVDTVGGLVAAPSAGGSAVYSAVHPSAGSKCAYINGQGVSVALGHTPGSSSASAGLRVVFWTPTAPTVDIDLAAFRTTASVNALRVQYKADGTLKVVDSASGGLSTSTATVPTSTPVVFELWGSRGTGANGQVHVRLWTPASTATSPLYSYDSGSIANLGTVDLASCRFGKLSATGNWDAYVDEFGFDLGRTSYIGWTPPVVATPAAPTVVTPTGFSRAFAYVR